MRRLLYLAALSMVVLLLFASAALAQGENAAAQYEPTPATDQYTPAADQYAAPQQPAQPQDQALAAAVVEAQALPATGGPALLLSAGVLLLGAGLLGMKLVRRS